MKAKGLRLLALGIVAALAAGSARAGSYNAAIGVGGGALVGNTASVTVPSGALSSTTTLYMETSIVGGYNQCELTPHGQEFEEPVTLSIQVPAAGNPNDVYHIAWWDESEEEWVDLGGTRANGYVSVQIDHFSRYIIYTEFNE